MTELISPAGIGNNVISVISQSQQYYYDIKWYIIGMQQKSLISWTTTLGDVGPMLRKQLLISLCCIMYVVDSLIKSVLVFETAYTSRGCPKAIQTVPAWQLNKTWLKGVSYVVSQTSDTVQQDEYHVVAMLYIHVYNLWSLLQDKWHYISKVFLPARMA